MKVIKPIEFSPSMLAGSTAGEQYSLWSSSTTYSVGQRVVYGDSVYESLQNANTNKAPSSNPTWWIKVSPSNIYAMFDTSTSVATTATDEFEAYLNVSNVDTVAFSGVAASAITVSVTALGESEPLFSETKTISDEVSDWYQYFFKPINAYDRLLFTGLPMVYNGMLSIRVTGGGTIKVGACIFGYIIDIGSTSYGAKVSLVDYSIKQTDDYGAVTLVKRSSTRRISCSLFVDNESLPSTMLHLEDMRATPTCWIGTDDWPINQALMLIGYYTDFSVDVAYPKHSLCTLEIEGIA